MEEDRYLKVNEAEKPKEEESPVIEKTTVRLFNTEAGEMKIEEERLLELLFMCIDIYWVKETAAGKRGIPIGTPFGHWFANIMLTPVDFVIKHIFKITE